MELADIFQWELDFARDIRKGDQFAMVYDRLYREGKYIVTATFWLPNSYARQNLPGYSLHHR